MSIHKLSVSLTIQTYKNVCSTVALYVQILRITIFKKYIF